MFTNSKRDYNDNENDKKKTGLQEHETRFYYNLNYLIRY